MSLSGALRARFYPRFTPNTHVKSYTLQGWRIVVLNAGTTPGKPLLCQRPDGKKAFFNFMDLERDFLTEKAAIAQAEINGFELAEKDNDTLRFVAIKS